VTINYQRVDPQSVGFQVMKERAQDVEARAYGLEGEQQALTIMRKEDPTDGQLAEAYFQVQKDVVRMRRAAIRARGAAPLSADEVNQVHQKVLEEWLKQIETSHAQQMALKAETARQLELTGEDAVNEDERHEIEAGIKEGDKILHQLEVRHGVATAMLKKLGEEAKFDEQPPAEVPGPAGPQHPPVPEPVTADA